MPGFTWHNSRGASSRIDYILASPPVAFKKVSLSPQWPTDHLAVEATVSIDAPVYGGGYWKMNLQILEERDFRHLFLDHFSEWQKDKPTFPSVAEWWESVKDRIRTFSMQYSKQRRMEKKFSILRLERRLRDEYAAHNNGGTINHERLLDIKEPGKPGRRRALALSVPQMATQSRIHQTCWSDIRDGLEAPITLAELTAVLGKMNRRKVPGLDGLPVEFYSTFWDVLGPELLQVVEDVQRRGLLTRSMRSGVLSLLHKKGDRADLGNWRPLTMLCVDTKLIAKTLTERLKKAMAHLVHSDQTCGVPGRSATWNLHLIRDAIAWVEDRNLPLLLVSLDQEKAFDRVDHRFLFKVLGKFGFGPNYLGWLHTLYNEVGSHVVINGFLSDLVPQRSGVRQGCPLSPLLYVLYIEPLACAIRTHPGVDGLLIPGSRGTTVKLTQYADDTTLFVSSDQSLSHALSLVHAFGWASGATLNLSKSVAKYFGSWKAREDVAGGLTLCDGPLKVLGVNFLSDGAARLNWEERLAIARRKIGLWKSRSLSFQGKVLALKVDILPTLLYLAHVYPLPRFMRRGLTRDVFNLVWGGRYEYVRREVMYLGKDRGGRDVIDFPLKLDCLFFSQLCTRLAAPLEHPHQHFVRLWLALPMRRLVTSWTNLGPKAETLPVHYSHAVKWSKSILAGVKTEALTKHRALYKALLGHRETRAMLGLEEGTWARIQPKGLDHRLQDLNWQCLHGKLPVRDVLHRHKLTRHPRCPRPECSEDETIKHVFWDCGHAQRVWGLVAGLCGRVDPQPGLTYDKVLKGWDPNLHNPFGPWMWLLVSITKRELWNARTALIRRGVHLEAQGVFRKIRADLGFRMETDVIQRGYHEAKERWKGLFWL
ncbi:uncharacterized protein LOC125722031 [Brienomyrus brachyistius]|uniref:uncharacterized protein LOC125722031 n=1 Tax=Brienomyrus brachyistius TaxID=42636 RepID=UPI0020B206E1|nr:uncharacterized protein LOC125722031 [Brienomyrus brachyistius]